MTRPVYAVYIQSGDWINRCVRFFGDRPMCGVRDCRRRWREGNVGIHHRTYERLGAELKTDLVPLCKACHDRVHDRAVRYVSENGLSKAEALEAATAMALNEPLAAGMLGRIFPEARPS